MTLPFLRPTYAEIDLGALSFNLNKARKELDSVGWKDCRIMLLVKANAYGHDALLTAAYAQEHKLCAAFGVASIEDLILSLKLGDASINE